MPTRSSLVHSHLPDTFNTTYWVSDTCIIAHHHSCLFVDMWTTVYFLPFKFPTCLLFLEASCLCCDSTGSSKSWPSESWAWGCQPSRKTGAYGGTDSLSWELGESVSSLYNYPIQSHTPLKWKLHSNISGDTYTHVWTIKSCNFVENYHPKMLTTIFLPDWNLTLWNWNNKTYQLKQRYPRSNQVPPYVKSRQHI